MTAMSKPPCKLFVIHGWGGTYLEAAGRVTDLMEVESYWHEGSFLVPRRRAVFIRELLSGPDQDRYVVALRKLIVARFLQCPAAPREVAADADAYTRFSEERLRRDYPEFGIPICPDSRWRRAAQLRAEAERDLAPVLDVLRRLQADLAATEGPATEADVRAHLSRLCAEAGTGTLLPLLEDLREMHETGGDLDTVSSAVMYARHFQGEARRAGLPFRYGHEYRFVFVNYHETFRGLAHFAPAELYAADLPISAFPNLERDIRHLHDHGVRTARFEDHHPYAPERRDNLQQLVNEGKLGFFDLSGPELGSEQAEEEMLSAAEMVYKNLVENTPDDNEAARRLRVATHGEDFVRDRTPLGILLTNLIKGGNCKVELAQILLEAMETDDALERLQERGWAALPEQWKADIDETAERLRENAYEIQLADGRTKIVSVLAAHSEPGKAKLTTGKAVDFIARNYPDAHYAFYCWGSSMMVARRLDHDDTTLNLGSLMPRIGGPSDGGHAAAAVCRPEVNPHYPERLLGRVTAAEFGRFNRYLASRVAAAGHPVASVRNRSVPEASGWGRGTRRLLAIVAAAVLVGLGLVKLVPAYRLERVRDSNRDFFPHIGAGIADERDDIDVTDVERML